MICEYIPEWNEHRCLLLDVDDNDLRMRGRTADGPRWAIKLVELYHTHFFQWLEKMPSVETNEVEPHQHPLAIFAYWQLVDPNSELRQSLDECLPEVGKHNARFTHWLEIELNGKVHCFHPTTMPNIFGHFHRLTDG